MAKPKDNIFRVSQKYEINTPDGTIENLKVVTTYDIVDLTAFKKNVGVGKKLKNGFGEENSDVVLNFCKKKFGEELYKVKEIYEDEFARIDFLNELYEEYLHFETKYGLKITLNDFRFKTKAVEA